MPWVLSALVLLALAGSTAWAETSAGEAADATDQPSKLTSSEDGWLDASGFLEESYGFMPIVIPITEPAVGYGAAGALMFLSKPLPHAEDGLGRPSITVVGGLGTENGTWGALASDMRYWLDDHLQTSLALAYLSPNLEFWGVGASALSGNPLRYNLRAKGGTAQAKYRFGDSRIWAGLSYAFSATRVTFDRPNAALVPDEQQDLNIGGVTPSLTYDTRDNFFTPNRGAYLEGSGGFFTRIFGSDEEFQRARLIGMQFIPLAATVFLGVRGEVAASFGDEPFYMRPFISLRGAPTLRYQGDEVAQVEAELRWQFWRRFSVVGFVGVGAAWNDFASFDSSQSIGTGGVGLRYELARAYGLHAGVDLAFAPDNRAVYIQIGSAWSRP